MLSSVSSVDSTTAAIFICDLLGASHSVLGIWNAHSNSPYAIIAPLGTL